MTDLVPEADKRINELESALNVELANNSLLREGIVDLELALEDTGWARFAAGVSDEFSERGRHTLIALCRSMAVSNPLIKRALLIRTGYIWGQGVTVAAQLDDPHQQYTQEEDQLNQLIDDFWEDNAKTLTGSAAQEELERALGTDGEVFLAAFTSPLTGRVQVRSTPVNEIKRIIYNPEDRDEPWFYVREYTVDTFDATTTGAATGQKRERMVHPALGYRPAGKIRSLDGDPVRWDAPMKHVTVNRLTGWRRGVPDVYAAIAWARMYRDFLVDWAGLTKSLSKLAWKMTGDTKNRATRAAAVAQSQQQQSTLLQLPSPASAASTAGGAAALGPGVGLEAVSKSGATIDATSGKPIAAMVASGVGLPVTMLLADPGVTGARAVAQTLDTPTILEMGMRRLMWQSELQDIIDHVVISAVQAPQSQVQGTTTIDDWGRTHTELATGVEPAYVWDWPKLDKLDPLTLVQAIVSADSTEKMPPLETARLLLKALGVENIDEVLLEVTDENGKFKPPTPPPGTAEVTAARRGQDPAAADPGRPDPNAADA